MRPPPSRALEREPINLVLVDLDRPDGDGIDIVRQVREVADRIRVIGVTVQRGAGPGGRSARRRRLRLRLAGAQRGEPRLDLPPGARRRARSSRRSTCRTWSTACATDAKRRRSARLDFLTGRELEILRALADGASTAEIARSLGIRPMTVQSHVKNILAKLGVHSKVEAVTLGWRFGLGSVTRSA